MLASACAASTMRPCTALAKLSAWTSMPHRSCSRCWPCFLQASRVTSGGHHSEKAPQVMLSCIPAGTVPRPASRQWLHLSRPNSPASKPLHAIQTAEHPSNHTAFVYHSPAVERPTAEPPHVARPQRGHAAAAQSCHSWWRRHPAWQACQRAEADDDVSS
jgi:hypothetical protein